MKALLKYGKAFNQMKISNIDISSHTPAEILLRVKSVGICGSDIRVWRGTNTWKVSIPIVLGHEFCSTIEEIGDNVVNDFSKGDRVVCETSAQICGNCVYCHTGRYNLCPSRKSYGTSVNGALSEYVIARPEILHRIPENLTNHQCALVEIVSVLHNAFVVGNCNFLGSTVVIQGPGPVGLMALQFARLGGAHKVIVLGLNEDTKRLKIAEELGADYTINIDKDDPYKIIQSLGDKLGVDHVIDCTGVTSLVRKQKHSVMDSALKMIRPNGSIIKIGRGPDTLSNLDLIVDKAVTIRGSFSQTHQSWVEAIKLLSGKKITVDPIISGVYELSSWEKAFDLMERRVNAKSIIVIDQ